MEYTITPSEDGTYIYLKIIGDISSETIMHPLRKAHSLGKKLGIFRYLTDATEARNIDSTSQSYNFAYNDIKHATELDPKAIIAVLVKPDDHSHDFIETVTRNAGVNFTIFRNKKDAIKHLME